MFSYSENVSYSRIGGMTLLPFFKFKPPSGVLPLAMVFSKMHSCANASMSFSSIPAHSTMVEHPSPNRGLHGGVVGNEGEGSSHNNECMGGLAATIDDVRVIGQTNLAINDTQIKEHGGFLKLDALL